MTNSFPRLERTGKKLLSSLKKLSKIWRDKRRRNCSHTCNPCRRMLKRSTRSTWDTVKNGCRLPTPLLSNPGNKPKPPWAALARTGNATIHLSSSKECQDPSKPAPAQSSQFRSATPRWNAVSSPLETMSACDSDHLPNLLYR